MIVNKYSTGGSGSGSTVAWNQTLSAGTEIAKITINGTQQNVYAPAGGGSGVIDTEMSSASTNAVQNKVIKQYVDDELDEQGEVVSRAVNQIYNELNNKQAKLTAGTGIEISGSTINCTVSGGTEYQAGSGITISGSTISCPNAVNAVQSSYITNIWKGTQAEYDAITTKDNNTFYIIM